MTASWNAGCKPGNPAAGQAGTDWADIVRNVPDLWLLSRDRGQVSEIVAVGAVGNGFQVFRVTPVGHANAFDLAAFCHADALLLADGGAVGQLVAVNLSAVFYQADDFTGIRFGPGDFVQRIFCQCGGEVCIVLFIFHHIFHRIADALPVWLLSALLGVMSVL